MLFGTPICRTNMFPIFHCNSLFKTPFTRYRYETQPVKNHYVFNYSHGTGRVILATTFVHFIIEIRTLNVLHNRNKTLTVRRSHGSLTVEFLSVFKVLRYVYRFQTLTVSVTVSHNFIPASCERNP